MPPDEQALAFPCEDEWLTAILSPAAATGGAPAARGVLIVVGGPQYRAGSHRQFALLARALADQGIPAMRFDYRGMGDSGGPPADFQRVDADLRAAIDRFMAAVPGLREVVLWGLCDAASAALFYARQDRRVAGLVLLNPWARTADGLARATLKHYYVERLLQPALWKKVASGQFEFGKAFRSFASLVRASRGGRPAPAPAAAPASARASSLVTSSASSSASASASSPAPASVRGSPSAAPASSTATGAAAPTASAARPAAAAQPDLRARMLAGWQGFDGPILLIISGADLTAQEFLDMAKATRQWRRLLAAPRVQRRTLAAADHTFSRREWRDQVAQWTGEWVRAW